MDSGSGTTFLDTSSHLSTSLQSGNDNFTEICEWCNARMVGHKVRDIGPDWKDGRALLALFNGLKPGVVDMSAVDASHAGENVSRGLSLFERHFDLIRFVDEETIQNCDGNELMQCMYVYLLELQRLVEELESEKPAPVQEDLIRDMEQQLRNSYDTGGRDRGDSMGSIDTPVFDVHPSEMEMPEADAAKEKYRAAALNLSSRLQSPPKERPQSGASKGFFRSSSPEKRRGNNAATAKAIQEDSAPAKSRGFFQDPSPAKAPEQDVQGVRGKGGKGGKGPPRGKPGLTEAARQGMASDMPPAARGRTLGGSPFAAADLQSVKLKKAPAKVPAKVPAPKAPARKVPAKVPAPNALAKASVELNRAAEQGYESSEASDSDQSTVYSDSSSSGGDVEVGQDFFMPVGFMGTVMKQAAKRRHVRNISVGAGKKFVSPKVYARMRGEVV